MSKSAIVANKLAAPTGPFSTAVRSNGFIFASGQVGLDPGTGRLIAGDVEAQTERIFANLGAVLEAAGKSFDDVVRVGVFLTDISSYGAMNAIYARFFAAPFPARTTVCVAALPLGAAIEIDLVVKD